MSSMRIDDKTTIVRSTMPVETTVGSEVVLMTLESGECLGLGETASDVWRLLAEPTHFTALVESLKTMYEAPADVIERDVLALLDEMHERHLIVFT